ncbi:hypothetical protein TNCV_1790221 [Trichonephila clavipes]|nr:hypothetical protein TNCV_1790221 [Trichonephila clavipes]
MAGKETPFSFFLAHLPKQKPSVDNASVLLIDLCLVHAAPQEEEVEDREEAERVAAKVVENVVRLASEAADQRAKESPPAKPRGCDLQRLPTFQIDTVPSPPWSPVEEPLDEEEIDIHLEEQQEEEPPEESASDSLSEEQRESLRTFIEDILSKAMGVAEKKLQFVGIDDDDEDEEADEEEIQNHHGEEVELQEVEEEEEEKEVRLTEEEEAEIRAAAEKVVEEVLSKAEELVAEKMADTSNLDFPITFDEAPDDVKDVASNLIKEIVESLLFGRGRGYYSSIGLSHPSPGELRSPRLVWELHQSPLSVGWINEVKG